MSKVVVVGGGGYVGCVLVEELLALGFSVRVVDRMFYGREPARGFLDRVELVDADMRDFDESHVADARRSSIWVDSPTTPPRSSTQRPIMS